MIIPNIWEVIKFMFQTTNQPTVLCENRHRAVAKVTLRWRQETRLHLLVGLESIELGRQIGTWTTAGYTGWSLGWWANGWTKWCHQLPCGTYYVYLDIPDTPNIYILCIYICIWAVIKRSSCSEGTKEMLMLQLMRCSGLAYLQE